MGNSAGNADSENAEAGSFFHQRHNRKTESGAGEAVEYAEHVSEQKTDDKDPDCGNKSGFLPCVFFKNIEDGQICKAKLDSGNSRKKRKQGFHIAENNGNGCENAQICCFFLIHILYNRVKSR